MFKQSLLSVAVAVSLCVMPVQAQDKKSPLVFFKIVKTVSGEDSFNPLSESQCSLVKK